MGEEVEKHPLAGDGFSPAERTPDYWLGFMSATVHQIARVRGRIGDLTYPEQFWPEHHAAKRRAVEMEARQLRALDLDLTDTLTWVKGFHAEAQALATPESRDAWRVARVGKQITISPADPEVGNACVSPDQSEPGCYWTLIGGGSEEEQNALAQVIADALNATVKAEESAVQPSPQPAAWIMRDWDAGKIDVTLSPDERALWERRGAQIEPLYALPAPPKAEPESSVEARIEQLEAALREAEIGLVFAGADEPDPNSDFVSTPALALAAVRRALGKEPRPPEGASTGRPEGGRQTGPAEPGANPPPNTPAEARGDQPEANRG